MKLRIRGDSLRLRLSQRDLATLVATGRIDDAIHFGSEPAQALRYGIKADGSAIDATFEAGAIAVSITPEQLATLRDTDEVGVTGRRRLDDGRELAVVIEKDFKCLIVRPGEDDRDGFDRGTDAAPKC